MKVCEIIAAGGPEQLVVRERPDPSPRAGEVLIRTAAVGVGLADVMMRSGQYPGVDPTGLVPGLEVAGTVASAGDGVSPNLIGRRVYAMTKAGGYAEAICLDAQTLVELPDEVPFHTAVGTGLNAVVARFAVERARVEPGQSVLVRGASGGIGSMVVQMAALAGARVTAASSRPEQVRSLGAHAVIDRSGGPGPYDAIIDPVAGDDLGDFFAKLAPNGRIVVCGVAGGLPPAAFGAGLLASFFASPTLSAFSLDSVPAPAVREAVRAVMAMAAEGELKPLIADLITLDQAADAHRALESGGATGKFVIVP